MIFIDVALGSEATASAATASAKGKRCETSRVRSNPWPIAFENQAQCLILNLYGGAIGAHQCLLVHANCGGIDGCLSMLGLRE